MVERDQAGRLRQALTHLRHGDLLAADAEVPPADGPAESPEEALWQGMRALLDGRLATCERRATEAAALAGTGAGPGGVRWPEVLLAALRREQGRPPEAETHMRAAFADGSAAPACTQAFLALLVAEMGRDSMAREDLDRLIGLDDTGPDVTTIAVCAEAASVAGLFAEADALHRLLGPHEHEFAVDERAGICHGSVARHLGRLCHVLGRPDEAVAHFDDALAAHTRAGAPLLVAHTSRQLAAVLRVWGSDAEWERSLDLLRDAATIYRRLSIDAPATEAQAVLARSEDLYLAFDQGRRGVFAPDGDGWVVGLDDTTARVDDGPGLADIARLLAAPRTALHVCDLVAGLTASDPRARTDRPWFWPQRPRVVDDERIGAIVDGTAAAAYEHRLGRLDREVAAAAASGDALALALARGERDVLAAELAAVLEPGDDRHPRPTPFERASRVVTTRIRLGVDMIEAVQPAAARHLRATLRTGTFCSYEPEADVAWTL